MENFSKNIDFNNFDPSKLSKDKMIIAGSAAASIIGSALPWYTARFLGAKASVSGLEFFAGKLVFLFSLLTIVVVFEGQAKENLSQRNTYLGLGLSGLNLVSLLSKIGNINSLGFWISLIATLLAGAVFFKSLTGKDLLKEASQQANKLKTQAEDQIKKMKSENETKEK